MVARRFLQTEAGTHVEVEDGNLVFPALKRSFQLPVQVDSVDDDYLADIATELEKLLQGTGERLPGVLPSGTGLSHR